MFEKIVHLLIHSHVLMHHQLSSHQSWINKDCTGHTSFITSHPLMTLSGFRMQDYRVVRIQSTWIYSIIWNKIAHILPPCANLYSSYINVLREGNDPGIHVDAPYFVEDNQTVLIYMNPQWDPQWGGETIFFNHDLDAVRLCQPRPGRVVIFDGRIPHTGRPPTPSINTTDIYLHTNTWIQKHVRSYCRA